MNQSESVGVDSINLVRVDFTSDVDTSEVLNKKIKRTNISTPHLIYWQPDPVDQRKKISVGEPLAKF